MYRHTGCKRTDKLQTIQHTGMNRTQTTHIQTKTYYTQTNETLTKQNIDEHRQTETNTCISLCPPSP